MLFSDSDFSCYEYDDDTTFTAAVCSEYDYKQCFKTNNACVEDEWCNAMCGESCDEGAGAICYFELFSDMATTCDRVFLLMGDEDFMAKVPPRDVTVPKTEELTGYGLDTSITDLGCARHSFCTYCNGDCTDTVMGYIREMRGTVSIKYLKDAMCGIIETCTNLGYLTAGDVEKAYLLRDSLQVKV